MYRWKNPRHKFLLLLDGQCPMYARTVLQYFCFGGFIDLIFFMSLNDFISISQERKGLCMKSHLRSDSSSVRC